MLLHNIKYDSEMSILLHYSNCEASDEIRSKEYYKIIQETWRPSCREIKYPELVAELARSTAGWLQFFCREACFGQLHIIFMQHMLMPTH